MLPPQPQLSLPTPQNRTFQGAFRLLFRRRSVIGLVPSKFTYSHHSAISCGVPLPTLPTMNGAAPSRSTSSKYSCVPNLLSSVTLPHMGFPIVGRLSGALFPSFHWCGSAIQVPAQRRLG